MFHFFHVDMTLPDLHPTSRWHSFDLTETLETMCADAIARMLVKCKRRSFHQSHCGADPAGRRRSGSHHGSNHGPRFVVALTQRGSSNSNVGSGTCRPIWPRAEWRLQKQYPRKETRWCLLSGALASVSRSLSSVSSAVLPVYSRGALAGCCCVFLLHSCETLWLSCGNACVSSCKISRGTLVSVAGSLGCAQRSRRMSGGNSACGRATLRPWGELHPAVLHLEQ